MTEQLKYMRVKPKVNNVCRCGHGAADHSFVRCDIIGCGCEEYEQRFRDLKNMPYERYPKGIITGRNGKEEVY